MNYTLNYTNNSIEMGYCDSRKVIDDLYSRFIFLSARMGINMLELIQLLMIKSNLDPTFSKNMKLLQSKKDEAKSFIYK
jgi:hypothetical protein